MKYKLVKYPGSLWRRYALGTIFEFELGMTGLVHIFCNGISIGETRDKTWLTTQLAKGNFKLLEFKSKLNLPDWL